MRTVEQCRPLPAVTATLWAQRHQVDQLLFKLVTAELVLRADERRFVARAVDEVGHAVEKVRAADLERITAVAALAQRWEVTPEALDLAALVTQTPEPWTSIFAEHQHALAQMLAEIVATSRSAGSLARRCLQDIQGSLRFTGRRGSGGATMSLELSLMELQLQEVAYRASLEPLTAAVPPGLLTFVGTATQRQGADAVR